MTEAQYLELYDKLTRIERKIDIMATTQVQLDAAIAAVGNAVTQLGTDLTAAITALQAKIGAGGSGAADFTTEVASLTQIANTLKGIDATAIAASGATGKPASPISAVPANVNLNAAAPAITVTLTESNGAPNTFNAVVADTTIATVSPASSTSAFTVNRVAAGTTTLTVTDAQNNTLAVQVVSV
jgi:hypothetical protein